MYFLKTIDDDEQAIFSKAIDTYGNLEFAHKLVQQGCFFVSVSSCNFDDQLSQNVQRFLFYAFWIILTIYQR